MSSSIDYVEVPCGGWWIVINSLEISNVHLGTMLSMVTEIWSYICSCFNKLSYFCGEVD